MSKIQFLILVLLIYPLSVMASTGLCHGQFANLIRDVCWSCMFPITIGDVSVFNSEQPDTSNPSLPVCMCPIAPVGIRIGISTGYWEPIALVDVTRHPYCMVNLGGIQLATGKLGNDGDIDSSDPAQGGSFYEVHWYKFPLLYWLNVLTDGLCIEKGDFDIAYLTELDPTWHDDELTFLLNPEAALFASLEAQAACSADSLATLIGLPIDSLFWCAGSQGNLYPLNGKVQEHVGGVQASTLLAERMSYKLHREGLLWDSIGENSPALCNEYPSPLMPKSRYRYQMVNPIPTASGGEDGCHAFGHTTALWGSLHEYPYSGEDFGYLIWRKRNCCAF